MISSSQQKSLLFPESILLPSELAQRQRGWSAEQFMALHAMQTSPFTCTHPVLKLSSLPSATRLEQLRIDGDSPCGSDQCCKQGLPSSPALWHPPHRGSWHLSLPGWVQTRAETHRGLLLIEKGIFMATGPSSPKSFWDFGDGRLLCAVPQTTLNQPRLGVKASTGKSSRKALRRRRRFSRRFYSSSVFSKTPKTNVNHSTRAHSLPPQFIPDYFSQPLEERATPV